MSGAKWTEGQIGYLRRNWPDKSDADIAKALKRSEDSVRTKRYQLGIRIDPADWSPEEDAYILEHWQDQTDEEMATSLHRQPHAVYARGVSLGLFRRKAAIKGHRTWTAEDLDYLRESWGTVSIGVMCRRLKRTKDAIINKSRRLGLGAYLDSGDYITLNQLLIAATGTNAAYSYKTISWVKNRGLPVHTKTVNSKKVRVVYLDEFWEWAEKNRSFLDFSKMEPLALGEEPAWVAEQRRKDYKAFALQRKDPWTPDEESRLVMLLKQHRYGYAELSEMLHRSAGAIQRKCNDLGLRERPVKADNHGKDSLWTESDIELLVDGIRRGDSYTMIGRAIGKSEKAVRGKVYTVYFTENADKVRAMMGNGPWGHGAPVPTVKQAVVLSRTRAEVKHDLELLCAVLAERVRELKKSDYDHFFQRAMCMKWDDLRSKCGAGCDDCDSCSEFQRIRPQYCVRCGATFYERVENRVCKSCRVARKKAAGRKWYKTHARKTGG